MYIAIYLPPRHLPRAYERLLLFDAGSRHSISRYIVERVFKDVTWLCEKAPIDGRRGLLRSYLQSAGTLIMVFCSINYSPTPTTSPAGVD